MTSNHHGRRLVALVALTAALMAAQGPPLAVADPTSALTSAMSKVRAASNCPEPQWNPLVQQAARMANQSTSDYINKRSAAVPFTDPMPALKTIGYDGAGKGLVLAGYGPNEIDALRGLILQYQGLKPDCSYSEIGVDALRDAAGFNVTAVVLVAPQ